jgi:hypothetical protein
MMRRTPYVLNNGLPALIWTRIRHHQQWVVGDTQVVSPTMVNNLRLGFSTDHIVDGETEAGQTPPDGSKVLTNIGLEGANPSRLSGQGFPEIDISGLTSLSNVSGGTKANNRIFNIVDKRRLAARRA